MNRKIFAIVVLLLFVSLSFLLGSQSRQSDDEQPTDTTFQAPSPYELWEFVNSERVNENVAPLRLVQALNQSARTRCEALAKKSAKPSYKQAIQTTYGRSDASAENLAVKSRSAVETVASWVTLGSKTRKSILNPAFTDVGYAVCTVAQKHTYLIIQHLAAK